MGRQDISFEDYGSPDVQSNQYTTTKKANIKSKYTLMPAEINGSDEDEVDFQNGPEKLKQLQVMKSIKDGQERLSNMSD